MINYACDFSQSETNKYFEWIIIKYNTLPAPMESDLFSYIFLVVESSTSFLRPGTRVIFIKGLYSCLLYVSVISRRQIGLKSMLGVYIVLAGGIIMAFITLVVEIYWKRRVKQSVANKFRRLVVVWADCECLQNSESPYVRWRLWTRNLVMFACRIRNSALWNPEFSSWNPEIR